MTSVLNENNVMGCSTPGMRNYSFSLFKLPTNQQRQLLKLSDITDEGSIGC